MDKILNLKLNKKGFTLVELLIAMAIIAVLIAIAAYGIQILQRNARNTRRRKIVQDIQLTVSDIQANYFEYPNAGTAGMNVTGSNNIEFNTPTDHAGGAEQVYTVSGFNNITLTPGICTTTAEEDQQGRIQLFWDYNTLTVGTKLEGTTACFNINV